MSYPTPFPEVIDSTILVCSRACGAKAKYQYFDCLAGSPSVDLHFGGAIAAGMETARRNFFQNRFPAREAENSALNAASDFWGDFIPPPRKTESSKNWGSLVQTLSAYWKKWPIDSDEVRPLADKGIEFTFAIPLDIPRPDRPNEPILYGGRFDLLGTWHDMLVILDEKTQGTSFNDKWSRKWALRNQFLMYLWAVQKSGYHINTVIVRGLSILKTKIDFAEAIVSVPPYMIERAYIQTVRDIRRLSAMWTEGYFDYNFGDSCTAYGLCPFADLCNAENPVEWYSLFGRRTWNPLAKDPTA